MKHFLFVVLATAGPGSLWASTISIDAEVLKDSQGAPMPLSGLVLLTAATTGNFTGPTAEGFTSGGEIIVSRWDLSGGFETPGVFADLANNVTVSGEWTQGDQLRLYWFPSLTINAARPDLGTFYGTYSDPTGVNGGAPWITPGPGDTVSLQFFTSDADFLTTNGTNPSSAGLANLVVVPEPQSAVLVALGLSSLALRRRRSSLV